MDGGAMAPVPYEAAPDEAAWAACPSLRFMLRGEHRSCERCPAVESYGDLGLGTRFCRHMADKAAKAVLAAARKD